jgi:hypothetical protein
MVSFNAPSDSIKAHAEIALSEFIAADVYGE